MWQFGLQTAQGTCTPESMNEVMHTYIMVVCTQRKWKRKWMGENSNVKRNKGEERM